MRIEATVPNSRGIALQELAEQLGLSKSQVIDEALAQFLKDDRSRAGDPLVPA